MTHPRGSRIEQLFDGALEQPAEERAAWLRVACPDDDALRDEVLRMIAAHESGPGVLDRPFPLPMQPWPPGSGRWPTAT